MGIADHSQGHTPDGKADSPQNRVGVVVQVGRSLKQESRLDNLSLSLANPVGSSTSRPRWLAPLLLPTCHNPTKSQVEV